ncbi:MAG: biosynthetic-type acetolactate synthase large subunit [Clostridiales bacterium]|nr:biosynthetic-type acetolactate synthase large subunit [Clostridiales bacterium]
MLISGAQALIAQLEKQGVELVFGYPGGAVLPIYRQLAKSSVRHVLTRTEQGAAHAAAGYARISGKTGVCLATSGPGATNLVTGLANAFLDSIPLVAVTGQVSRRLIGTDAFQEVDITGITQPITKHNYLVTKVEDIPRIVDEAFYIAGSGRPGPVLIDVPKDVSEELFSPPEARKVDLPGYKPTYKGHPNQIKSACRLLGEAKRPLIYAGGGVVSAGAWQLLQEVAERINAPVITTLMGLGVLPSGHELSLGMLGLHGMPAANVAAQACDVLLAVGARFGDRVTGPARNFAAEAAVIHIDIDPAEIGKNTAANVPIVGDVKLVLAEMLEKLPPLKNEEWLAKIGEYRQLNAPVEAEGDGGALTGKYIIKTLSRLQKGRPILVSDVGQHQMTAAQFYDIRRPGAFLNSGGLGSMGFGLPAAIGAQLAAPQETVICVCGDGGLQMSMSELAVAKANALPLKILLFNNGCLGLVRQMQHHYCDGEYFAVDMPGNPDFVKLAAAYGIAARRVETREEAERVLREVLENRELTLVECVISKEEMVFASLNL